MSVAIRNTLLAGITAALALLAVAQFATAGPSTCLAAHEMTPVQSQGQQMPISQQGGISGVKDQMNMRGGMPGMSPGTTQFDPAERIEGLLAFFRVELRITQSQSVAWNSFADALRSSHRHLIEARKQLSSPYFRSPQRLEQYERHLAARVDAVKTARLAYIQLYESLDDAQKHAADDLVAPFLTAF